MYFLKAAHENFHTHALHNEALTHIYIYIHVRKHTVQLQTSALCYFRQARRANADMCTGRGTTWLNMAAAMPRFFFRRFARQRAQWHEVF